MRAFRSLLLVALTALSFAATPAGATSCSTDNSDLWWNSNESGWGIQFIQRSCVIFATMFVYDAANNPVWYTATLNPQPSPLVWAGTLYATRGPWLGANPFNPSVVVYRAVGTMTWSAPFVNGGTLTYSVDSVPVTKSLVRLPAAIDDFSGTFYGGLHETDTGCVNTSLNGTSESLAAVNIVQNGTSITITTAITTVTCTYIGTLRQDGQFGSITGGFACTSGAQGTFQLFEVAVSVNDIRGRYTASGSGATLGCQANGYFAGFRHR